MARLQSVEAKRQREKRMVQEMVALYCRKKHGGQKRLCPECAALAEYAGQRSDRCPFMETKTFCSACKVHCYSPQMQQRVKAVMRYAGPRMLFVHPVMALKHVKVTLAEKKKNSRKGM